MGLFVLRCTDAWNKKLSRRCAGDAAAGIGVAAAGIGDAPAAIGPSAWATGPAANNSSGAEAVVIG